MEKAATEKTVSEFLHELSELTKPLWGKKTFLKGVDLEVSKLTNDYLASLQLKYRNRYICPIVDTELHKRIGPTTLFMSVYPGFIQDQRVKDQPFGKIAFISFTPLNAFDTNKPLSDYFLRVEELDLISQQHRLIEVISETTNLLIQYESAYNDVQERLSKLK